MSALGAQTTGLTEGELRGELWRAVGLELVRRFTWAYEVAAFVGGVRGDGVCWTPRVRPVRVVADGAQVGVYGYDRRVRREMLLQR